jgi:hypothetical protein
LPGVCGIRGDFSLYLFRDSQRWASSSVLTVIGISSFIEPMLNEQ